MATQTELKGARELIDLDVREVSLVDRPANLREFLVVKRLEDSMGVYESDYSTGGVDPSQVSPVLVKKSGGDADPKIDNGNGDPAVEVAKQTTDGGDPVDAETIAKAVEGETVDMTSARHAYEVAALKSGKGEEAEEALMKRQEAELEKAEEVAKAKADADKAGEGKEGANDEDGKGGKKPPFPGVKPFKAKTTKSVDGGDDDDGLGDQMVVVKRDGSVHVNGEEVQKASSEPTTLRTAAVSAAVTALAKQLGDLSDEDLAKALDGINKGQMPTNPKYRQGVHAQGTKTTKAPMKKNDDGEGSGDDETNPIVAAVQEALAPIQKRLEDIEKTRTPSKSADGDGGTDTQQPVAKGFWNGIL